MRCEQGTPSFQLSTSWGQSHVEACSISSANSDWSLIAVLSPAMLMFHKDHNVTQYISVSKTISTAATTAAKLE